MNISIRRIIILVVVSNLIAFIIGNFIQVFNIHSIAFLLISQAFALGMSIFIVKERVLGNLIIVAIALAVVQHINSIYSFDLLIADKSLYFYNLRNILYNILSNLVIIGIYWIFSKNLKQTERYSSILIIPGLALLITSLIPFTAAKLWNLSWTINTTSSVGNINFNTTIVSAITLLLIWFVSIVISRTYLNLRATFEGFYYCSLLSLPVISNFVNIKYFSHNIINPALIFVSRTTLNTLIFFLFLGFLFYLINVFFNKYVRQQRQ